MFRSQSILGQLKIDTVETFSAIAILSMEDLIYFITMVITWAMKLDKRGEPKRIDPNLNLSEMGEMNIIWHILENQCTINQYTSTTRKIRSDTEESVAQHSKSFACSL